MMKAILVFLALTALALAAEQSGPVGDPMLAHPGFSREYLKDLKAKFPQPYCEGTPAPKAGEKTHLVLSEAGNCWERHNRK